MTGRKLIDYIQANKLLDADIKIRKGDSYELLTSGSMVIYRQEGNISTLYVG